MFLEDEMIFCFEKARILIRSITLCTMGTDDTTEMFDELLSIIDKIRMFIKLSTNRDNEAVADLAVSLIQDAALSTAFVRENASILAP